MSFFGSGAFDASAVDPNTAPEPVPAGDYKVMIIRAEEKPTANRAGSYLELEAKIDDASRHKGRKLFFRINLKNASQKCVEIGMGQLSALCHATGVLQLSAPRQLVGKTCVWKVGVKEHHDKPGVYVNDVSGVVLQKQAGAPAAAAPAPEQDNLPGDNPQAGGNAPAWGATF